MAALYDSVILVILVLVFIGFVWLQQEPPVAPVGRVAIQKEGFQSSGGSGSGSGSSTIPLPMRTLEMNAAKKIKCNLENVFAKLQCSAYLATNPNAPTVTSVAPASTVPVPSVTITGSINNLSNVATVSGGDLTGVLKPNDMIYFGYMLNMQGPFVVKSVTSTSITFTSKYVGANIYNSVLTYVSSTPPTASPTSTTPVVEISNGDEPKKEVYAFGASPALTLATAATACASFGGTVATYNQLVDAYNSGAHWCWFTLVKDDITGAARVAFPIQTGGTCIGKPAGIAETTGTSSGLACYGVKPPQGTTYSLPGVGILPILNFSNPYNPTATPNDSMIPTLYNSPNKIFGSVRAGTNYITTGNVVLPDNLNIGDMLYIQGNCNKNDTDNGDGTCTAYDCRIGETDILDNTCQQYKCRDKTGNQLDHINNNDGTCAVPDEYALCASGYSTVGDANNIPYCYKPNPTNAADLSNNYNRPIVTASYRYDIIKAGTPSTTYPKLPTNPSYKYPKSLGPYYVAANPAIGKLVLKSKTAGDFDTNGKFKSISAAWKIVTIDASSIAYGNGELYYIDAAKKKIFYLSSLVDTTAKPVDVTGDFNSKYGSDIYLFNININFRGVSDINNSITVIPSVTNNTITYANTIKSVAVDPNTNQYGFTRAYYANAYFPYYRFMSSGWGVSNGVVNIGSSILQLISSKNITFALMRDIIQYNNNSNLYNDEATPPYVQSYNNWYTVGPNPGFTQLSFDGFNMTLMGIKADNSVWYADTNITTAPVWVQLIGTYTLEALHFTNVSHSNGKCVGIGIDSKLYYLPTYKTTDGKQDITGKITPPTQVSFDGYAMSLVVLNANGVVYYRTIPDIDPVNKVSALFGLQNVTINKVAYDTKVTSGSSGSKISLNKKILGCSGGTYGPSCTPCTASPGSYCPPGSVSAIGTTCPVGYYCPGGTTDKQPCTAGNYCPAGAASQKPCTVVAGYYCPTDSVSATGYPCPVGYYCPGGVTATPCPRGTTSIGGITATSSAACTYCPNGTTSSGTGGPCTDCPTGQISSPAGTNGICQNCVNNIYGDGTYANAGKFACLKCDGINYGGGNIRACLNQTYFVTPSTPLGNLGIRFPPVVTTAMNIDVTVTSSTFYSMVNLDDTGASFPLGTGGSTSFPPQTLGEHTIKIYNMPGLRQIGALQWSGTFQVIAA